MRRAGPKPSGGSGLVLMLPGAIPGALVTNGHVLSDVLLARRRLASGAGYAVGPVHMKSTSRVTWIHAVQPRLPGGGAFWRGK